MRVLKVLHNGWYRFSGRDCDRPRSWAHILPTILFLTLFLRWWASLVLRIDIYVLTAGFLPISAYPARDLFDLCLFAPIIEEMLYRCLPLFLVVRGSIFITERFSVSGEGMDLLGAGMIMGIGLCVSAVFGYQHGSVFNIAVQGVFGFAAWNMMIYASRLTKDFVRGVVAVILMHSAYNFFTLYGFFL